MYTFPALSLAAGCSIAHKLQKGPPDCNESTCEEGYRRVMCAPAIGGNTEIGRRVGDASCTTTCVPLLLGAARRHQASGLC